CAAALGLGFVGLATYAAYLHVHDARLVFLAIKLGTFGLLLPVFVTVAHRMFPFFARGAVIGHAGWSPLPWLGAFWALAAIHLGLELRHAHMWLWLPDAALSVLTATWLWRNWPRGTMPPLLRVLFCAYLWLPAAFVLFAAQSASYAATGVFALGRAPAHALFIGFFGSLLVAMVTRVTQGHSGRPLVLGPLAAFAFVAIQVVAVARIAAELLPSHPALQAFAAAGWLVAFAPWALRSARVYLSARADGKPG
ncbi:MAG TPA: NnrS family protein, partial [Casimicrobiaceae bacterium]